LTLLYYLSFLILGIVVGSVGSFIGIGGGVIVGPSLILLGVEPHYASGTSLSVVFFTGLFSAIAYFKRHMVNWKLGLILELATTPGGFIGSMLTSLVSGRNMKIAYAILLFALSIYMWKGKKVKTGAIKLDNNDVERSKIKGIKGVDLRVGLLISFLAGLSSGFFGIGGGVIKVPMLVFLNLPIHVAVATSSFMIAITSLSGIAGHLMLGHVKAIYVALIAPGIILGTQLGSRAACKTKPKLLRRIFSIVLATIAISIILK